MKTKNIYIFSIALLLSISNLYATDTCDKYTNNNNIFDVREQYLTVDKYIENNTLNTNAGTKISICSTEIYSKFIVLSPKNLKTVSSTNPMGLVIETHVHDLISNVLNRRLFVLSQNPSSSIISAGVLENVELSKDIYSAIVSVPKYEQEIDAIALIASEIHRIQKHGIIESELALAVRDMRNKAQVKFEKRGNGNISLKKQEDDYQYSVRFLSSISACDINLYTSAYMAKDRALTLISPQTTITDEKLLDAFDSELNKEIKAPEQIKYNSTLLVDTLKMVAGDLVSMAKDTDGTMIWTLSNGAVVYYKRDTNINDKEVLMKVSVKGGYSLFEDHQYMSAKANGLFISGGEGSTSSFNTVQLSDALSGCDISMDLDIYDNFAEINAKSFVADVNTLFQLINLKLTSTNFSNNDINIYKSSITPLVKRWENSSELIFNNQVAKSTAESQSRAFGIQELANNIDSITVENSQNLFNTIIGNSMGAKFFVVGSIPDYIILELVKKYIGSIDLGKPEMWKNRISKKSEDSVVELASNNPRAKAVIVMNKLIKNSYKANLEFSIFSNILEQRLLVNNNISDVELTAYNLISYAGTTKSLKVAYTTNSKDEAGVRESVIQTIYSIANEGITEDEFEKSITMITADFDSEFRTPEELMCGMTETFVEDIKTYLLSAKSKNKILDEIKISNIEKNAKSFLKNVKVTEIVMK